MRKLMQEKNHINVLNLLPIMFVVGVIPLIVRGKMISIDKTLSDYWKNEQSPIDVFSYWRSIAIIITSIVILAILIYNIISKKAYFKKNLIYIPVSIYLLMVLLSTVFSNNKNIALFGTPGRYEGMIVQIAYIIIFLYTINMITNSDSVVIVCKVLIASALIISIIGIFQYFGLDYLKSDTIRRMIIPEKYYNTITNFQFKAGDRSHYANSIYSTLFNANTFGLYMSMLVPLTLGFVFSSTKIRNKIITGAIAIVMIAALIGSNSRGSYIAVILAVIVLLTIIYLKKIKIEYKSIFIIASISIIVFIGLNYTSGGNILHRILQFKGNYATTQSSSLAKINSFEINENQLQLTNGYFKLDIKISERQLLFFEQGNQLYPQNTSKSNEFIIPGSKYEGLIFKIEENLMSIVKNKSLLRFAIIDNNFVFVNVKGKTVKNFTDISKLGFDGFESIASGRGYIWSRTLPLLADTIFLGKGPNSFIFNFPQNDYLGKLQFMKDANIIIDKPHSYYLETAVNTGIISLLMVLIIFSVYFFTTIKTLKYTNDISFKFYIKSGIFCSIIAYLINSIFTDSHVSVTPVFWVMIGIGVALNNCHATDIKKSLESFPY